ncbi:tripartite tricarboxylate transporter substrate binding protein [Advenella sp. RU8]|uniref:tripartite tricarboxylate transporter substrate binding protein n=1 Tax=Advenella sp. RU8 TaxID=3399575 RepID=UPI003AABAA72
MKIPNKIKTLFTIFTLAFTTLSNAETYPDKPIRLVVPYPTGGSVGVAANIIQEPLATQLGQSVVIEYKGGAGGTIGTSQVAKSDPDGYTLLLTLSSHTINPAIYETLPFDTEKDLTPVSLVASAPQVLVANPSFPPSTIKELITFAQNSDTPLIYGSAGVGTPSHIAVELFKKSSKTELTHVPYRGGGPATIDVLGGQIPLLWVSLPAVTQHIKSGKLKALAVSTTNRTPVLPDVPAVSETLPGFNVDSWYAMFAPANTPETIINKIQTILANSTKDKAIQEAFLAQGAVAVGGTTAELDHIVKTEIPLWRALAAEANIKIN